jgi:AcrR family transcriptional regulator
MAEKKRSPQEKLVVAALSMIETEGWQGLSLTQLARQSKIPIETVFELCPDKHALLKLIGSNITMAAVKRMSEPGDNEPARDRAFDAILIVFEAMADYKPALAVIYRETRIDPSAWFDMAPVFLRSAEWIADNARLPTNGLQGLATTRAIAALLAETFGVWLDDGEDLAKTMAHVDRRLRSAESWLSTFKRTDDKQNDQKQSAD